MMRRFLEYAVFAALVVLAPLPAEAATTVYTGSLVVPVGNSITLTGAAAGCALVNSSSIVYQGSCPVGTAAFSGTSPIVITGTNPYTISCPTCLSTAGGTVSGNVTFSGTTTFSGAATFNTLPTSTVGITNSSTSVAITSGASGSYSAGFKIGSGAGGFTQLSTTNTALGTCGVAGTALAISASGTLVTTDDTSGNLCTIGAIYYTSARDTKQNIRRAGIDGLAVLRGADFDLAWEYLPQYGDPHQTRYGPMADDLPSYISGPKHDRVDLEALVVTEGIAIKQLDAREKELSAAVLLLLILCLGLLASLGNTWRGKNA